MSMRLTRSARGCRARLQNGLGGHRFEASRARLQGGTLQGLDQGQKPEIAGDGSRQVREFGEAAARPGQNGTPLARSRQVSGTAELNISWIGTVFEKIEVASTGYQPHGQPTPSWGRG
jgi:hypothetical protein